MGLINTPTGRITLGLILCDALARTVIAPIEIPVGVITALIGGPFFLILLRKRRQQGWLE